MLHKAKYLIGALFGISVVVTQALAQWQTSPGNPQGQRQFSGVQINPDTIGGLDQLWRFDSGFSLKTDTVQATPIYTGTAIITVNLAGDVMALRPETGAVIWHTTLTSPVGRRGMTFVSDPQTGQGYLFVPTGDGVVSLNAETGDILQKFDSGLSLLQPYIADNRLFVATLRDGIKAFDRTTGAMIWQRSVSTDYRTIRIWSGFSYDEKNNMLFVVTSNPGGLTGQTDAKDDLSVSLVAIDAGTGKIQWHYQHIKQDIWDLDLVGNPVILHDALIDGMVEADDVVIALSKTGEILVLRISDGTTPLPNAIRKVPVAPAPTNTASPTADRQNLADWPTPIGAITLNLEEDFSHLPEDGAAYVRAKLRHAKSGWYLATSPDYDLVMYGLHGGPEWPGAALSLREGGADLLVPFNRNPWILRIIYTDTHFQKWQDRLEPLDDVVNSWDSLSRWVADCWQTPFSCDNRDTAARTSGQLSRWSQRDWLDGKRQSKASASLYPRLPGAISHPAYQAQCSQCHGVARQGAYQSEFFGDGFYPSLIGLHSTHKWPSVDTARKVIDLHKEFDIDLDISSKTYTAMMTHFRTMDEMAFQQGRFKRKGLWQLILDNNGLPATTPPWGGLASVNLNSGAHNWSVPLGVRSTGASLPAIDGDINFGGVMTTASGIGFATGTPDSMVRAFNMADGSLLWKGRLPYAGSAPPMGFNHRGCDMIVVTATGGRFVGFQGNGDSTIAFKLRDCIFQ